MRYRLAHRIPNYDVRAWIVRRVKPDVVRASDTEGQRIVFPIVSAYYDFVPIARFELAPNSAAFLPLAFVGDAMADGRRAQELLCGLLHLSDEISGWLFIESLQEPAKRIELARDFAPSRGDGLKRSLRLLVTGEVIGRRFLERCAFGNVDLDFCLVSIVIIDDPNFRSVNAGIGEICQNQIAAALEPVGRFEPCAIRFNRIDDSFATFYLTRELLP